MISVIKQNKFLERKNTNHGPLISLLQNHDTVASPLESKGGCEAFEK
jgi:hypothetical protein